jgi:hypothetical protein
MKRFYLLAVLSLMSCGKEPQVKVIYEKAPAAATQSARCGDIADCHVRCMRACYYGAPCQPADACLDTQVDVDRPWLWPGNPPA